MTELDPANKIGRRNSLNKISGSAIRKTRDEKLNPEPLDRVSISQTSAPAVPGPNKIGGGSEIRGHLVEKFRAYLENGSYRVKADEIADKMVQKIRESKNRLII